MVWLSTVGSLWAFLWITIKKTKLCVNKTKKKLKPVSFREFNIKYSKRKKKLINACFLKYKITTLFVSHGYHIAP